MSTVFVGCTFVFYNDVVGLLAVSVHVWGFCGARLCLKVIFNITEYVGSGLQTMDDKKYSYHAQNSKFFPAKAKKKIMSLFRVK